MDGLYVGTDIFYPTPDDNSEALDSNLKFTESGDGNWFIASGSDDEYYYDGDAMKIADVDVGNEGRLQGIVQPVCMIEMEILRDINWIGLSSNFGPRSQVRKNWLTM